MQPTSYVNIPDWVDKEGQGCAWYAVDVSDSEIYSGDTDTRCELWSDILKPDNTFAANDACCACGGGLLPRNTPSSSPTMTHAPSELYPTPKLMKDFPTAHPTKGVFDFQLCNDYPGWVDSMNRGCLW